MSDDEERKRVMFSFDIYKSGDRMDGADVIDAIRSLNLNPTISLVNSLGGRDVRGDISHSFDEFWDIYCAVRDDKNEGGFVDFIECLKIFDVGENGFMKLADLTHMLLNMGEAVTPQQLDLVMSDCQLEEEDDDGWFPYLPFLCRLCEQPIPKDFKPAL